MKFKKYIGHFLHTLDGDDDHLYRALTPAHAVTMAVARDSRFFVPFESTDYTIDVGNHSSCPVIRIPKLPFQVRIQETTRARAMQIVRFLIDFAIDCHAADTTPSDVHEGNILWWDRPYFVDFNALRPLNHPTAALTFVRIGHLFYKYACGRRHIGEHDIFDFAALAREGGWMAEQIRRPDFTDPSIWSGLRDVMSRFDPPAAPASHWSDEYALAEPELAKNPKFVQVLKLAPPGRTLLDVGCNKGYTCRLLADRYEDILGFDTDEACIDQAATEAARLNFACFGIEHLALQEPIPIRERFHADVVLALAVTHHFESLGFSVPMVSKILSGLTKKHLLIEDIVQVGHYHRQFKAHGLEIAEHVPSHPSGRMLTLWRRKD